MLPEPSPTPLMAEEASTGRHTDTNIETGLGVLLYKDRIMETEMKSPLVQLSQISTEDISNSIRETGPLSAHETGKKAL